MPWLFLLAWWVLALIAAAAGYAAWNRAGLSLHLSVGSSIPAPGSPAGELPEQLLRRGPFPAPVFEGDGFGLEILLRGTRGARGPVWAIGQVGNKEVWAGTGLVPKAGWSRVKSMRALRRGVVSARGWRIHTSDPLGFFRGTRPSRDGEVALILPRFMSLEGRRKSRELEASVAAPRAGSGSELLGIREYRPGDSLRRIHWRSSARHGELVVREYEPPGIHTLGIYLDPEPLTTEVADQIARIAASEAWDCLREGGRVVLSAPGLEATQPLRDLWAALKWLARYPKAPSGGFAATSPASGEVKVVITATPNPDLPAKADRVWVVGDAELDIDAPIERVGTKWPI